MSIRVGTAPVSWGVMEIDSWGVRKPYEDVLDEMAALTPAHRRTIKARKRAYFELTRQTLRQLSSEGKLRNVDPTVGVDGHRVQEGLSSRTLPGDVRDP